MKILELMKIRKFAIFVVITSVLLLLVSIYNLYVGIDRDITSFKSIGASGTLIFGTFSTINFLEAKKNWNKDK